VAHSPGNYERLEFIGDAVFDLAVAHLLSDRYPGASEGELSKMRAALVKGASFAAIAQRLSLGSYIKLSRSELANGANNRASILSDVLEAVVGAVYLDGGFEAARECISRLLRDDILNVVPRDPKTELQELLHAANAAPPIYRLDCTEGPEHSPVFITSVEVYGRIFGHGRGSTKKASQQAAAEEALSKIAGKSERATSISEPQVAAQESVAELIQEEAREDDRSE
jgi:ribonuclease-3